MSHKIDLSGVWDLTLSQYKPNSIPHVYDDTITLSGTTSLAKKGTPNPRREIGHLTDAYAFEGQAWYHKIITLKKEDVGHPIFLTLERTRLSELWINGKRVGNRDSLATPHIYDITEYITTSRVDITLCITNTGYPTAGGHLTSPDTQSNWNGITGEISLNILPFIYVDNVRVYPCDNYRAIRVKMCLHGASSATLHTHITADNNGVMCYQKDTDITITGDESNECTIKIPLFEADDDSDAYRWDEYNRCIFSLQYAINGETIGEVPFGLCDFRAIGRVKDENASTAEMCFTVNGRPCLLRGKHDGMIFPLTGFAPTDVPAWRRVFTIAQNYGINHYRFHTCCPPEAAFTAADQLGIYLEPELPFWGTIAAPDEDGYNAVEQNYLINLGLQILDTFGNHPSFVLFSLGNELWGSPERLGEILRLYKAHDPRHLYTQGCNNFQHFPLILSEDDYFVGVRLSHDRLIRGSFGNCDPPLGYIQSERPSTLHTYDTIIFPTATAQASENDTDEIEIQYGTGVKKVKVTAQTEGLIPDKPVISHEIGQYAVYPNFHEIDKYTGPLEARNLTVFRERLAEKHMLERADDFFYCSGMLAAACYKEELEAVMRSQYIAGFQVLDLQDFSGQGTALVGMLDAFLDNKGFVTPEKWRESCSDCVIMAAFPKYVYTTGESFSARILLRNYRPDTPSTCPVTWQLCRENNTVVASGEYQSPTTCGRVIDVGIIDIPLPTLDFPETMTLRLHIPAWSVKNSYTLTVYPTISLPPLSLTGNIIITQDIDTALDALYQGGRVFFLANDIKNAIDGFYCTDFWCYPMFRDICVSMGKPVAVGTMGLCIDENHPALSQFPTKSYTTPPWYDIITRARAAILDDYPDLTPIVSVIDNFERNHKLGILFEACVGNGKLLICTSRLHEIDDRDEVRWLMRSLMTYIESDKFAPRTTLTADNIRDILQ